MAIERDKKAMSELKKYTYDQLKWALESIPFKRTPLWHQYVSILFASQHDRVMFPHPIGSGKTSTAYYAAEHVWKSKKILVVCPSSSFGAWLRDIKWTDYKAVLLTGSAQERLDLLRQDYNVYIINYEGLKSIYGGKIPSSYKQDGTVAQKWVMDPFSMVHPFDCVVFDEVHRCNNYKSLQSQICLELSKKVKHVIGLSGTPLDKHLLELFNLYQVIDNGRSLGSNFFEYRARHFKKVNSFLWVPKHGEKEYILERISNVTLGFDRSECYDLPECNKLVHLVNRTDEFNRLENLIIKEDSFVTDEGLLISCEEKVKLSKLRQLTSGFIYGDRVDECHRLEVNPKLDALSDLLRDSSTQTLVFYVYNAEEQMIRERLESEKLKVVTLQGGMKPEERIKIEDRFRDGKADVCLAQVSCAGEGFDATSAEMSIFFDILASPRMIEQCIGRMHRRGQTKKTIVFELLMQGTLDDKVKMNQEPRKQLSESYKDYMNSRK